MATSRRSRSSLDRPRHIEPHLHVRIDLGSKSAAAIASQLRQVASQIEMGRMNGRWPVTGVAWGVAPEGSFKSEDWSDD